MSITLNGTELVDGEVMTYPMAHPDIQVDDLLVGVELEFEFYSETDRGCDECDGTGRITETCDMGHEHEDDCGECYGSGRVDNDYGDPHSCWEDGPGNLRGWESHGEHCGVEVKFEGPERFADAATMVNAMISHIERNDGAASYECGHHVHINCNPEVGPAVSPEALFQVWKDWGQDEAYDLTNFEPEYRSEYGAFEHLEDHHTLHNMIDRYERYVGFNACALAAHGTIELRCWDMTTSQKLMDKRFDFLRRFLIAVIALDAEMNQPINSDRFPSMDWTPRRIIRRAASPSLV